MDLWAVTMVRDEIDILPYTLAHLVSEGVTGLIVADNGSTDGTREWLYDASFDCKLMIVHDDEVGYYQSRKMTALAQMAVAQGADWIIPFDADELWFSVKDRSLHASLCLFADDIDALQVRLCNYFPTSDDDEDETNPFLRITHRDRALAPLSKVIVLARPDVTILQGNHNATGAEPFLVSPAPIQIAHFPWRSPEQFVRKVRNGAEAYRASDLPVDSGAHWRQYGEILDSQGPEAVIAIYHEWFCDPETPVVHDPAPWCRFRTPA
jgi:hypothetical protein